MSDTEQAQANPAKPPVWFWIVAIVALLWNLLGLLAFVAQLTMTPEMLAALPEAERGLYANFPVWLYIPFGVAVIGGTLACVLLLMRKAIALELFVLSLVGVIVQNVYSLAFTNVHAILGAQAIIMPIVVIVIGVGLILLARSMKKNGVLS